MSSTIGRGAGKQERAAVNMEYHKQERAAVKMEYHKQDSDICSALRTGDLRIPLYTTQNFFFRSN